MRAVRVLRRVLGKAWVSRGVGRHGALVGHQGQSKRFGDPRAVVGVQQPFGVGGRGVGLGASKTRTDTVARGQKGRAQDCGATVGADVGCVASNGRASQNARAVRRRKRKAHRRRTVVSRRGGARSDRDRRHGVGGAV